jgi:hypothetical protein
MARGGGCEWYQSIDELKTYRYDPTHITLPCRAFNWSVVTHLL